MTDKREAWRRDGRAFLAVLVLTVCMVRPVRAQEQQSVNIVDALQRIASEGQPLSFDRGRMDFPRRGHLQGVQLRFDADHHRYLAFLSHDSESVAYLAIVEFAPDLAAKGRILHVHTLPGDGRSPPLRHAGGLQLLNGVLVVGLEDNQLKTRSEIQFWDVSNPLKLLQFKHLTIRRAGAPKDKTAGAVGLVQREKDLLLAVANWDSRAIDFYTSNDKPLADPLCRFELQTRWQDATAEKVAWRPDRTFGAYQSINLIGAVGGRTVFLLGTCTDPGGRDLMDLYSIDTTQTPQRLIEKLVSKQMRFPDGIHFQFSGGASMVDGRWVILSSERDFNDPSRLGIAR